MSSVLAVGESPGKMYALAVVLMILATVAVILRIQARRMMKASIAWDDFFVVIALLFTFAIGVCMIAATAHGGLGGHTRIAGDGRPIIDHHTTVLEQAIFASQLIQTIAFGSTKLAVLCFYRRLLCGRIVDVSLQIMIAVTISWTIAYFFANLFQCLPVSTNWTGTGTIPGACINTNQMYLSQAWSDIFTDVIILSLPIPSIWSLRMPTSRKVAVSCLLLLGVLVVIAGIAKLVVFYNVNNEINSGNLDIAYVLTPTVYWPMVEASLGVVSACLPSMRPLFNKCVPEDGLQRLWDQATFRSLFSRHSKSTSGYSKDLEPEIPMSSNRYSVWVGTGPEGRNGESRAP